MRVGCVGVGAHATTNLYPNLRPAGLELVATCARHLGRAQQAADAWGCRQAFDDVDKMLASADLDAAIVCVDVPSYAGIIERCLRAGIPVFCDKPGAASSEEARRLAHVSATTGVPVVVGYMKRFAPSYWRARQIVTSASFGAPSLGAFTFAMGKGFDGDLRTYLIDNPVHHLNLAAYLLGDVTNLDGEIVDFGSGAHVVAATARTDSGAVCTFNFCTTASWNHRNEYVEIYGDGHSITVDNVDTLTYRPPEPPESVWRPNYTVALPGNSSATVTGFAPELQHFRDVILRRASNVSTLDDAATTLALAERLCDIAGV